MVANGSAPPKLRSRALKVGRVADASAERLSVSRRMNWRRLWWTKRFGNLAPGDQQVFLAMCSWGNLPMKHGSGGRAVGRYPPQNRRIHGCAGSCARIKARFMGKQTNRWTTVLEIISDGTIGLKRTVLSSTGALQEWVKQG